MVFVIAISYPIHPTNKLKQFKTKMITIPDMGTPKQTTPKSAPLDSQYHGKNGPLHKEQVYLSHGIRVHDVRVDRSTEVLSMSCTFHATLGLF